MGLSTLHLPAAASVLAVVWGKKKGGGGKFKKPPSLKNDGDNSML